MGAPLSVENSTDSANEAAQSGLRPGHPCGVPPDKPAPPPAQMAGLRPGLFARARLPPRGALRTAKATRAHRKAVEAFFCRSAGSGKGKRLERAYGASWRFLRTLKLSCRRMAMAQRHGRRDTPPPRRPMAVEREKGACSAYHPSPRPSRQREGSESPSVVRGAAGGALRFLVCPLTVSVGPLLPRQGAVSSPFGLRAAPTP